MRGRRRLYVALGVVVAIVVLGIVLARRQPATVAVREVIVHTGNFTTKLPETGVVQLPRLATLPIAVAGNVATIAVRSGDRVRAGQLLATIVSAQIVSNLHDAQDTAIAADGHAQSIAETNAALPEQNRSSIVQAEAAVVSARSQLTQAEQDLVAGSQSGLGYGGDTAEGQRLTAESALSKANTDLGEAERTYRANQYLYDNKGISRDQLMQSRAHFDEARVTFEQARSERKILGGTLTRETQVLRDRVRSAQDGLRQAEAALAAARANGAQSKAGDLAAARADAARAHADLAYAEQQAARLEIRAPFDGTIESVAAQANDSLRPLQPGDAVTPGQALFTLSAGDDYIVRTRVDEQDIASVALGQRAITGGEDFGSATLGGHVAAISPIAQRSDDPSNTSRQVVTTIALDKRLPFLRDGMSVDVDIVTHDERNVLTVPAEALRQDAHGSYVFVVRDGRAVRTAVKLGTQNDTQAVVKSGLHDGDTVVADKSDIAADARVRPADEASAAPVAHASP
jgi:RND family efflux transporter MFP subunit